MPENSPSGKVAILLFRRDLRSQRQNVPKHEGNGRGARSPEPEVFVGTLSCFLTRPLVRILVQSRRPRQGDAFRLEGEGLITKIRKGGPRSGGKDRNITPVIG